MEKLNTMQNRQELLATIAEMYFIEGKNQAEIAKKIGVTRSNISRMLTEARNAGIIKIQINRPVRENTSLAQLLVKRFALKGARVVVVEQSSQMLQLLGVTAAKELANRLKPGKIIGTSWGTAVSATVEHFELNTSISDIKVVQLLGALGARIEEYDAHAIVRRLAEKLNAQGIYINAPFLVDDQSTASSLLENKSVQESLSFARRADIALLGVGSSELAHCSYFLADYVSRKEILEIQKTGAIGDVCGRFFDINGNNVAEEFQKRLIGTSLKNLLRIPIRIGVAGGLSKIDPIIGALRGRLINILISDVRTISEVIKQTSA